MGSVPQLRHPRLLVRVPVLIVALAAALWLAVSIRDLRLQNEAVALLQTDPPRLQDSLNRLQDAGLLNAGRDDDLLIAAAQWRLGRTPEAARGIRRLLREEPDNTDAWVLYASLLDATDPAAAAYARRRARALTGKF